MRPLTLVSWKTLLGAPARRSCALKRSAEDPDAFAEFYALYAERVLTFFARRVMNVDLAMDLTAETFAQALAKRKQFRGSTIEQEQGWLFAVARSELSHFWRHGAAERKATQRYGIQAATLTDDSIERVEKLAGLAEIKQRLVSALDGLPASQRRAVELRVLHELGYDEVAAALEISEDLARQHVSRGLRTLAKTLAPVGDTGPAS